MSKISEMSDKNFKLYTRRLQHEQGHRNQEHPTNVRALEVARLKFKKFF